MPSTVPSAIINFMGQLDWVLGCPDTWSKVILGMSVRVFLDDTNIQMRDQVKQMDFRKVGGPHPVEDMTRTETYPPMTKRALFLPDRPTETLVLSIFSQISH